jgi:hypothetical protein
MLRGAARGSVELLALATLSTAAIPVLSLIGALAPSSGLWFSANAGALGVDIGAALGALCFAWMWRKTWQRVGSERVDSVWSVRGKDGVQLEAAADDEPERLDAREVVETREGR